MIKAKYWDNASSTFFFFGFVTTQLRAVPIALVSTILKIASSIFFLTAYLLWLVACQFYPDYQPKKPSWTGLASFKDQNKFAALLGALAILLTITGLIYPPALLAATWLLLFSNGIWLISELNKKHHPFPEALNFSNRGQSSYVLYAVSTTGMALVTAIAATIIFVTPAATSATLLLSTLLVVALGVYAISNWISYAYQNFGPNREKDSYQTMLANDLAPRPELTEELIADIEHHPSVIITQALEPEPSINTDVITDASQASIQPVF